MLTYWQDFLRFNRACGIEQRKRVVLLVLGGMLMNLLELAGLYALLPLLRLMMQPGYNSLMMQKLALLLGNITHNQLVLTLGLIVAIVFVAKNIFQVLYQRHEYRVMAEWRMRVVSKFFHAYQYQPYESYLASGAAQMMGTLSYSIPFIMQGYVQRILMVLNTLLAMLVILGFVIYVNWQFFVVMALVGVGLMLTSLIVLRRQLKKIGTRAHQLNVRQQQLLQQSFAGYREVHVYHKEHFFSTRALRAMTKVAQTEGRLLFFGSLSPAIIELVVMCLIVAVFEAILLTSNNVPEATAELGIMVVASMRMMPLLVRLIQALTHIQSAHGTALQVIAEAERLKVRKLANEQISTLETSQIPLPFNKQLQLQNVSYTYSCAAHPTVAGIDLTIKPGQFIGITGPSGGGKSTLVNLLLGLLKPSKGKLSIDSVPVTEANLRAFHQTVGLVDQQVFVINGTVAENVAFGVEPEDVDAGRIRWALKQAQLWETVKKMPAGVESPVGENGSQLSGGQRQRLVIARAFYRDLKLLILDEASAALDVATEHELFKTLEGLKGKLSVVMIAHRLSTLQNCDRVYFLKDGKVEDSGTFTELYKSCKEFKLYLEYSQLQYGKAS